LERNQRIPKYLSKLSLTVALSYSLWNAIQKHPQIQYALRKQDWAESDEKKTETFTIYIYIFKIFKPNMREITLEEKNKLLSGAAIATILDISTKLFIVKET